MLGCLEQVHLQAVALLYFTNVFLQIEGKTSKRVKHSLYCGGLRRNPVYLQGEPYPSVHILNFR